MQSFFCDVWCSFWGEEGLELFFLVVKAELWYYADGDSTMLCCLMFFCVGTKVFWSMGSMQSKSGSAYCYMSFSPQQWPAGPDVPITFNGALATTNGNFYFAPAINDRLSLKLHFLLYFFHLCFFVIYSNYLPLCLWYV